MIATLKSFLYTFISLSGLILFFTGAAFYERLLDTGDGPPPELATFGFSLIIETAKAVFVHAAVSWAIRGRLVWGAIGPAVAFFVLSVAAHSGNATTTTAAATTTTPPRPVYEPPAAPTIQRIKDVGGVWNAENAAKQKTNAAAAAAYETETSNAQKAFEAALTKWQADSTTAAAAASQAVIDAEKKGKTFFYLLLLLELINLGLVFALADLDRNGPLKRAIKRKFNPEQPFTPPPLDEEGNEKEGDGESDFSDDPHRAPEMINKLKRAYSSAYHKYKTAASQEAENRQLERLAYLESELRKLGSAPPEIRTPRN